MKPLASSRWHRFDEYSSIVFRMLLRLLVMIFAIFIIIIIYSGIRNVTPAVKPFEVPQSWQEAGLNGNTVARLIVDQVQEIKDEVASQKVDSTFVTNEEKQDLEVNVMGVGLSLNSISYYLKGLLGISSPVISGEVIQLDSQYVITVRMTGHPNRTAYVDYNSKAKFKVVEEVILQGGKAVLFNTDPYRVAVYAYKQEDYEQSLEIIKEMIRNNERDVEWAYLAWGNMLKQQKRPKEAVEKYREATKVNPNFTLAYNNLAWEYMSSNNAPDAIKCFLQALSIEGNQFGILHGLAQAYRFNSQYDSASYYFEEAIDASPSTVWAYNNYASMKIYQEKDTVAGVKIMRKGMKFADDPIEINFTLISLLAAQNKLDSAMFVADRILELDNTNFYAKNVKHQILQAQERDQEAYELGESFVFDLGNIGDEGYIKVEVLNRMAMHEYKQENFDKSISLSKQAIEILPDLAYPYTTMAEAYGLKGDLENFFTYFEIALQKGFSYKDLAEDEPYKSLQHLPRFQEIVAKYSLKG